MEMPWLAAIAVAILAAVVVGTNVAVITYIVRRDKLKWPPDED
jgi:hypothetical protein